VSKKGFQIFSDKIVAPALMKSYTAIKNTTETPEFKPFVELFLSKTIHRILANLACSCEDSQENGLLSNIVKSLISALTFGDHEDVSSQKNGLDALEKILGEYTAAVKDYTELEVKYSASDSTIVHSDLIEKQKIVKELRAKISGSILAKAGLRSAADLQLVILPFANANLEDSVWESLNNQLPDYLIQFCNGLKYDTLLSSDKKTAVESLEGYADIKSDSDTISSRLMPKIFNALSSNYKRSMIGHSSKDFLDKMAIEGLERSWIEELLKTLADNASDDLQIGNSTIHHFWKILESILAPRLLGVMENAAIHKNVQGNFFENMIINCVNVIQNSIDGNQSILNAGLIEYDKKCLKAEACDWRDRYLKDVKGIKAGACDVAALNLTSADIGEILKLYAVGYSSQEIESQKDVNYSIKRIWDLKKALANTDKPEENIADVLTHFFMEASSDNVKKEQQECLTRVFGPASDQVLKLIGFTSDKALSLFDTEFAFVRESTIPLVISIIYRDMSDFKGVHAENNEKLETYFGENKEALENALNVISKQEIVGKSIKGYLKNNGARLASNLKGFLPKSSEVLGNTIEKFATSTSVTGENAHPSQLATNRITSFIEDLVHANLVQVLTSICAGSPVTD
jgi:hypothetical protein